MTLFDGKLLEEQETPALMPKGSVKIGPKSPPNSLLAAALDYAQRGLPVLPCHSPTQNGCSCQQPDCSSVGKHPRTAHGLKDASTDPELIKEWWRRWPTANVAVAVPAGYAVVNRPGFSGASVS